MKICIWRTGHEIADTVAEAVYEGLSKTGDCSLLHTERLQEVAEGDVGIGYGILRGMDKVFRSYRSMGRPFIHIDKGYFKPGHYDGYYRISLNGTQQTTGLDKLEPDYARWDALGVDVLPTRQEMDRRPVLYCPETHEVGMFFRKFMTIEPQSCGHKLIVRRKNMGLPLQPDLDECCMVYTFNSSVGWEALRQGIPVVSDATHSIVGAYQKLMDKPLHMDYDARKRLFAIMSSFQLTLAEIKAGAIWPVIQKLLTST